jgi:hypothetical protein
VTLKLAARAGAANEATANKTNTNTGAFSKALRKDILFPNVT